MYLSLSSTQCFQTLLWKKLRRNIGRFDFTNIQLLGAVTKVLQLIDYLYINSANCSEMDKKQYRVITEREADIVSLSGEFPVLSRICALFDDQYYVTSNRESGEGRFDIQLMPKNNSRPGVLIELK